MRVAIFYTSILVSSLALADDGQPASVATMPPVVVKTIPEAGSIDVDSAITEIRATFSKPMITENFSWVQTVKDAFPTTTAKPHFEADQRTCVLPVKLEPGKTYVLWLNQGKFTSFMDRDGRRAVPYMLVFQTKGPQ
jgi:RNA polymerase sigma-70 factor (ECF subfamily)